MKATLLPLLHAVLLCGLLSLAAMPARASQFPWTLNHYQHTAFAKKEGAPAPGQLVETADGYLWGNEDKGLVRFDGHRFQTFVPPPGEALPGKQVQKLFAPSSGGLWVSFDYDGASFIHQNHVTSFSKREGFSDAPADFYQDRAGTVVAYAYPGVLKFVNGQWTRVLDDAGLLVRRTCMDREFNLWAITKPGRLLVLREGASAFQDMGVDVTGATGVSVGPNRSIFVATRSKVTRRFVDEQDHAREVGKPLPYATLNLIVDRRGLAWAGTLEEGIHFLGEFARWLEQQQAFPTDEVIDKSSGLTGSFTRVMEDRHGSIWVSTDGGIDRFTPSPFSQVTLPRGMTMASVAAGGDGEVWIGSENYSVRHLARETMRETVVPSTALATFSTANFTVYAATAEQLWQLSPGTPRTISDLPSKAIGGVYSMARDNADGLWLAFRSIKALMRFDGANWTSVSGLEAPPRALLADASGVIWVGYGKDQLAAFRRHTTDKYSARDGLAAGVIKVLAEDGGVLWIGGERCLQRFDGHQFSVLTLAGGQELSDISGLLFDHGGNMWVQTLAGIFRISQVEVQRVAANRAYTPAFRKFGLSDGVPGSPAQTFTLPTLRLGSDGRIWVSGQTELAWLDPAELLPPLPLRRPIIERVTDGAQGFDLRAALLKLPKTARDLRFEYTAPELQFPDRVRYQYRLRGFNDAWQDGGREMNASYRRLSGGSYVFEVRATTEGQAWDGEPSSIAFEIAPVYYERRWFQLLVAVLGVAALWGVVRFQMRVATYRERSRLQIRLDEREAVARDLHDTLLQSNLAVVLQLKAMAERVDDPALKMSLAKLATLSRDVNIEGREKIQMLRTAALASESLVDQVFRQACQLSTEHGIKFERALHGRERPLEPAACIELLPLLNELLANAFQHAKASTVSAAFSFAWWRLEIAISDDGVGLVHDAVWRAQEGHWGLLGVRERARRLGARIHFRQGVPAGTVVRVAIPAWRIYARTQLWHGTLGGSAQ